MIQNISIPRSDYYATMYDIEGLTHLNRARKERSPTEVRYIEDLIRDNKCLEAKKLLRKEILRSTNNTNVHVLQGALWIKDRLFSGIFGDRSQYELSPKNCSLKELGSYLNKSRNFIEKEMLVEVPVERSWREIDPDPLSKKEVDDFYMRTDSYIFELMAANHIVQTLYSFFVLVDKLKDLNVTRILDYGAGVGTLSILFDQLGYGVTYADLPGKTYNYAKWRFKARGMHMPMMDLVKDQNIQRSFDCIICTEVIEHVVDPLELIDTFRKLLRSGDILVVSESCEYVEDFSSHLENNRKYGGKNFIDLMKKYSFIQIMKDPFIPQLIFQKD